MLDIRRVTFDKLGRTGTRIDSKRVVNQGTACVASLIAEARECNTIDLRRALYSWPVPGSRTRWSGGWLGLASYLLRWRTV